MSVSERSAAAEAAPLPGGFRRWRRTRPFWGGLLAVLAGAEIILIPLAPVGIVVHQGMAGVASWLAGALLIASGALMWCQPEQRAFLGVLCVLLSLVSFVTSNLGGFLLGMLLGMVGGALGFAWTPHAAGTGPGRSRAPRHMGLVLIPVLLSPVAPDTGPAFSTAEVTLKASSLTMSGLTYDGVVALRTRRAAPVRALRFSMERAVLRDVDQRIGKGPRRARLRAESLTLEGDVVMYTTRMSSTLLGLGPLTFTPEHPPPLVLPHMVMTDVTAEQPDVLASSAVLRGLRLSA
ncbi:MULTISPECIES: DUF6114 domain-containing protein [unclassified Spirillospora]|uniref:DUF6114 domain-containing protein n=1 Tax=unclassified Spirillospora TaxID=2642701 RepID=UPI003715FA70